MKKQIISNTFQEKFKEISRLVFSKYALGKNNAQNLKIEKLNKDLYGIVEKSSEDNSFGILEPSLFWEVIEQSDIGKHFSWQNSPNPIITAKLN